MSGDEVPSPNEGPLAYPLSEPSEEWLTLARALHYEVERLELGYSELPWERLSEAERDLFLTAVRSVIRLESAAVLKVLADDDLVGRGTEIRKNADIDRD